MVYGFRNHLRGVPWDDIFKLSASAAASEFCERDQVGIDVYIPHRKYQVKRHSSPWISAACGAGRVQRNYFFRLYQQNKSSESKVKFRQASDRCKRVLENDKIEYATKTKESITSQKLGSRDFCNFYIFQKLFQITIFGVPQYTKNSYLKKFLKVLNIYDLF